MKDVNDPGDDLLRRIEALGPWFHNLRLGPHQTAPGHFLGDFPRTKFERFAHAIPEDLSGRSVLDIGCNAGFYSLEMKRRGASRVLGIDHDEHYLAQARLAAEVSGLEVEFRRLEVYDVGALSESFDIVFFMGVLYHLRHPLLALDLIREHVAGDVLVFPVAATWLGGGPGDPARSALLRGGHVPAGRLSGDALHRAFLLARLDELVGPEPRRR
jgi:tRNA (mo5U34)-methyltransferase